MLPVVDSPVGLDKDERRVLDAFAPGRALSSSQVVSESGFGKDKALRLLAQLSEKGLVRVQGSGRGTRYVLA